VLAEKIKKSTKPIFPVFPSYLWVKGEIEDFVARGGVYFHDEVLFGAALTKVFNTPPPATQTPEMPTIDTARIRRVIDGADNGYLAPAQIHELLDAAGIARAREGVADTEAACVAEAHKIGWPLVMKVVGPVHKSDVGGVVLNVSDDQTLVKEFRRMMQIPQTTAILLAQQLSGTEVFIGAKREGAFGHLVMCGLGGIFIEVLKDVQTGLAPIAPTEAGDMLRRLRSYGVIRGVRGREGVNEERFAQAISRISALVAAAPEIFEMDLNPLLGNARDVVAVDARIRVEKF
jgi:acetyltransferase